MLRIGYQSYLLLLMLLLFNGSLYATSHNENPSPWDASEIKIIQQHLLSNIVTPKQTLIKMDQGKAIHAIPGAVLASPSNKGENFSQDYQFHWMRDAAITMQEVLYLYQHATGNEKNHLHDYLVNYIAFETKAQQQLSSDGEETVGQPKFNIDGTIWEGKWQRPQND